MARLSVGTQVKITSQPLDLISSEKVLVRVDAGCLWAEVLDESQRIGAIVAGPSEYAVDAIVQTREGAAGRAFRGQIEGLKLYIGGTNVDAGSRNPSIEEIQKLGYESEMSFIEAAGRSLETYRRDDCRLSIRSTHTSGEGFLFWGDDLRRSNVIFVDGHRVGFIHDGKVFVVTEKNCVYVGDGTVVVGGPEGKGIVIERGKIREPRFLRHLGPMISDIVHDSLSELRHSFRFER